MPYDLFEELDISLKHYTKLDALAQEAQEKINSLRSRHMALKPELQQLESSLAGLQPFQSHNDIDILSMRGRYEELLAEKAAIIRERDIVQDDIGKKFKSSAYEAANLLELWREIVDGQERNMGIED